MKIKAIVSFSGILSMSAGEIIDCDNAEVVNGLLDAGYVEEVKEAKEPVKEQPAKAPKRSAKKTG